MIDICPDFCHNGGMKTIVAAVDFSDVTPPVVETASGLAAAMDARLHLIHTVDPGPNYAVYGFSPAEFPVSPITDKARENADNRLKTLADTCPLPGDQITVATITAMPVEGILRYAEENEADLIIVGAHGHGFLGAMLIGSVAQGIVRRAERPTLIVPGRKNG